MDQAQRQHVWAAQGLGSSLLSETQSLPVIKDRQLLLVVPGSDLQTQPGPVELFLCLGSKRDRPLPLFLNPKLEIASSLCIFQGLGLLGNMPPPSPDLCPPSLESDILRALVSEETDFLHTLEAEFIIS